MKFPEPGLRLAQTYKMLQLMFLADNGRPPTHRQVIAQSEEFFEGVSPIGSTSVVDYQYAQLEDMGLITLVDAPYKNRKLSLTGGFYVLPRNFLDQRPINSYSLIVVDARNMGGTSTPKILNILDFLLGETHAVIITTGYLPGEPGERYPKNRGNPPKPHQRYHDEDGPAVILLGILEKEGERAVDTAVVTEDKQMAIAAVALECGVFGHKDVYD
jgi:hypothetical protein